MKGAPCQDSPTPLYRYIYYAFIPVQKFFFSIFYPPQKFSNIFLKIFFPNFFICSTFAILQIGIIGTILVELVLFWCKLCDCAFHTTVRLCDIMINRNCVKLRMVV